MLLPPTMAPPLKLAYSKHIVERNEGLAFTNRQRPCRLRISQTARALASNQCRWRYKVCTLRHIKPISAVRDESAKLAKLEKDRPGTLAGQDGVAHTGFEPVVSALRGRRPRPLDECARRREGSSAFTPSEYSVSCMWLSSRRPSGSVEASRMESVLFLAKVLTLHWLAAEWATWSPTSQNAHQMRA